MDIVLIEINTNPISGMRISDPVLAGLNDIQKTFLTHGECIDRNLYKDYICKLRQIIGCSDIMDYTWDCNDRNLYK